MRAASRLSLLLTVAFIPGLFGCTRSSTTRSSCFNEYVSLEQVQSYSDALDLTVKNVFTKEDSLPRCQSLVDAVVGVKAVELKDLQAAVKEAGVSNNYDLCVSTLIKSAGLEDNLVVTTHISGLDRTNALLAAVSNPLQFDAQTTNLRKVQHKGFASRKL